ncbi:MAG: DUF945 family protein [Thiohalocapsa sp.]
MLAATLGLAGDVEGAVRVPDVTCSGVMGRLHFLSGLTEFELAPQGRWTLSGQPAALEAEDPGGRKLCLEGLGWSLTQSDAGSTLPLGALSLTLERLSLDPSAAQPALALGGLEVALGAELEDAMVAVRATGRAATLTVGNQAYAPSRLALFLVGLPARALQALRDEIGGA